MARKPYLTSSTLVEWYVSEVSTTLFLYSSIELLKILMVIFQVMKISGQPPPLPHAEGVAQQRNIQWLQRPSTLKAWHKIQQGFSLSGWWDGGECPHEWALPIPECGSLSGW